MTVPSSAQTVTYTGTAATATYAYTNVKIFDETDLEVSVTKISTLAITPLVINTDYTVTGVGIAAGGNVVLVNASQAWLDGSGFLTASYTITIKRVVALTQQTSVTTQGQNLPEYVEKQFDRCVMIDQQQQEQIDRCLKLPDTEPGTATNTTLPNVDLRKNTIAAYDADGDPTTAVLSSVGANTTASYVTISAEASLTNERQLIGTSNQITVTDNGAGSTVAISMPSAVTVTTLNATTVAATTGNITTVAATAVTATHVDTTSYIKTTPGAAPSLANGQQWSDSTQIAPSFRTGGMTEYAARAIYRQTAAVTVANTTAETTLLTTGVYGTNVIPAGYLTAGKTIRMTSFGTFGITSTPVLSVGIAWTIGVTTTSAYSTITTAANSVWKSVCELTVRTAGSSGVLLGSFLFSGNNAGNDGTNPFTGCRAFSGNYDLSGTFTVAPYVLWGTASTSNTITCFGALIEVIG
jgi:hypothetical protein